MDEETNCIKSPSDTRTFNTISFDTIVGNEASI